MTQQELEKLYIQTEHGLFTPIYTYKEKMPIYDEEKNIIDCELVEYVQTMAAKEYYQQWLYNKENPQPTEPSKSDKISTYLERLDLQEESTLDIDYRLTLMELCI